MELAADEDGVATADAALEDAGVPFGGVAMTLLSASPCHNSSLSRASSLSSAENHFGIDSFVKGGLLKQFIV